ncbi:MAG: hypothetical protein ACD_20C00434G0007 [uncultured bacterium]|nr:MAG: hypothetical protein ACD_20C00434G0007 [uncultured bacterium]
MNILKILNKKKNKSTSDLPKYSYLDEEYIIFEFLKSINLKHKTCVDIGAGDGLTMSNTYALFKKGWAGLAVEYNSDSFSKLAFAHKAFPRVSLAKCKINPENISFILRGYEIPKEFGFLSLDIDGYDYFVLEEILNLYRPSLICTEINEKIPPPIKFTVKYDSNYTWAGDHFFGQSISQLQVLCSKFNYDIIKLEYNNAFLVPKELNPFPSLTPEEAYKKGYLEKLDRKEKFPWNANMEEVLTMEPSESFDFINRFFAKYEGKYTCII